jgi:hypothetical protein
MFNNDTATVTGWTVGTFDWQTQPTDTFGVTPTVPRAINLTTSDTGLREDNYGHTVSVQQTNRSVTVDNHGDAANYTLGLADDGTVVVDGTVSDELTRGSSVTTTEVWNGSWLTPTEYDFAPQAGEVTLGIDYIGDRMYELSSSKAVQFTGVNITANVTAPPRCAQTNNTKVDIGASTTENYTVQFSCPVGTEGSPAMKKTLDADGDNDTHHNWTTDDMEIYSDETTGTNVTWKADKDNLSDIANRKAKPVGYIDGNSSGVTVTVGAEYVYVTFTTDCCSSSPHSGTHSASLFYEVGDGDTSSSGSTGGSGGGSQQNADLGAEVVPAEPYTVEFGSAVNASFDVRNYKNEQNTIELSVNPDRSNACAYVKLPATATGRVDDSGRIQINSSDVYGHEALIRVPPASAGLTGSSSTIPVPVEITMPDEATYNRLQNENGSLVCRFSAKATKGDVNDLVVEVQPQRNPFTGMFVRGNQLIQALIEALLDTFATSEQMCFGESNTALLVNRSTECPESAQQTRQIPTPAGWAALFNRRRYRYCRTVQILQLISPGNPR